MSQRRSSSIWWLVSACFILLGSYAAIALLVRPSARLTAFGDIVQCVVPLYANAGLLMNAASPHWRKNSFWTLLALGCSLWLVGQLEWTYFEVYQQQQIPDPFPGDIIFFLHLVPMIAALALQPHQQQADRNLRFGYLDFTLLLLWWLYLYLFVVIPWEFVAPDIGRYNHNFNVLNTVGNLAFLGGLGVLCLRTLGYWRAIYLQLFGAASIYAIGTLTSNVAINQKVYYTGSLYDLPIVASFLWYGTAGIFAYQRSPHAEAMVRRPASSLPEGTYGEALPESAWPAWLAMAAVLSLPALGAWCMLPSAGSLPVRHFRLVVTLGAIVTLSFLVFLRQYLVDADRLQLVRGYRDSIENLKRLQTQFVEAEKLASLGQLAAGAAHEINNPLTAILGYSDMVIDHPAADEKVRTLAEKIREQARRTTTLVTNLLSFARQVPTERTLLDINNVVATAVQLRGLDLRGKNSKMELQTGTLLPGVRGDPNQLLQVFFNIISNAVDAMEEVGGGVLTVRTLRERGNVVILFSDTGPGIEEPHRVFDPFYTTKPVGKGTGLGLSICYGVIQEHGGQISCYNRPEGGAIFRIELPAVLALFPALESSSARKAAEPPGTRKVFPTPSE